MSEPEPQSVTELERAFGEFSAISRELVAGYDELRREAEKVEQELARTNLELERKVAELDAVRSHLEAVLAALPVGVLVRDARDRVVRANPAAERLLDAPEDALVADGDDDRLRAAPEGEPFRLEREGAAPRTLVSRTAEVRDGSESLTGSVQILDDRTEVTRLSERVHVLDKLAALGTLTAGVAHEIRNPLNAVQGFARLLANRFEAGTEERRFADRIVEGSAETERIVAGMQNFARPAHVALAPVCAEHLAREAVEAALVGHGDAVVEVEVEPARLRADRVQLRQALRNLIANAIEAQEGAGRVRVRGTRAGDAYEFGVDDAGPGVPPETAARVFDPFFTSRAEGTGLGLAIAHTIARLHGGALDHEPSSLGGARFVLRLPLEAAAAAGKELAA